MIGDRMRISPDYKEFAKASDSRPIWATIQADGISPQVAYHRLRTGGPAALLESAARNSSTARYSIIGTSPRATFSASEGVVFIQEKSGLNHKITKPPLDGLRDILKPYRVPRPPEALPFFGGAICALGYGLAHSFERLPRAAADDLHLPDVYGILIDNPVVFDHETDRIWVFHTPDPTEFRTGDRRRLYESGCAHLAETVERLTRTQPEIPIRGRETNSNFNEVPGAKADYILRVERCKAYIAAGDIYQANLSHRIEFPFQGDPWLLYQSLTAINPSPFASFIETPDFSIVSASPERLVCLEGGGVATRPIAGTRPRGSTADEDTRLAQELIDNAKERAEHIMLVDLERNDLGRVCEYGSVEVDQFMATEKYSHVMHIVSNVRGRLRSDRDAFDVIRAVFPGGTITGVPKVRCMEIIDELEPVARGFYTGSIGYISFAGEMDLNIVIRTVLIKNRRAYVQVGAGIVADSEPENEFRETLHKATAMLKALETSNR